MKGKKGGKKLLEDAKKIFQYQLEQQGERFLTDAYIPKDGIYRLIVMNSDTWEMKDPVKIHFNKKTGKLDVDNDIDFPLIKELDYNSNLLTLWKPIDPKKKIHSNHYLSLAVKMNVVKDGILTDEIIRNYYKVLKDPMKKYEKKSKAKALYQTIQDKYGPPDVDQIEKIEEFVLTHDIWEGMDLSKKDYVKVFFVYPDEEKTKRIYQMENERYLIPHIFNRNDFNIECEDGTVLGLPNDNMTLNDKKPFLKNLTRKVATPYLLSQEDVLFQKKFFDYLSGQVSQKKYHIYFDNVKNTIHSYRNDEMPGHGFKSGYHLRCKKTKDDTLICEKEIVTHYQPKFQQPFYLKTWIELPEKFIQNSKFPYGQPIEDHLGMLQMINTIFYEGALIKNLFLNAEDISIYDSDLKEDILKHRKVLIDWFWNGRTELVKQTVNELTINAIKRSILAGKNVLTQKQFNYRWSLLDYLDQQKTGESMSELRKTLRKHINSPKDAEWEFESDDEYLYAVGEVLHYLIYLSNSSKKNYSFIRPFVNTTNYKTINQKLKSLCMKYSFKIQYYGNGRFEQLISHIFSYQPKSKKINTEPLLAAFASKSLIYEKKEN